MLVWGFFLGGNDSRRNCNGFAAAFLLEGFWLGFFYIGLGILWIFLGWGVGLVYVVLGIRIWEDVGFENGFVFGGGEVRRIFIL